ncbi:AraC family transcriptional regulator [Myxococcus sp. K15C18031901]|uniref:AraC family transcriptional regulator n=1 Tax=Myxococcus dinghuensis TaxID=2906761 RepID=UPI0020A759ED|nr:AraC family transcriptional regulator ligand-binding domain-containing protein [Myxococcus dinghuensis]MCP3104964.1 AraC family transcriptional regulator [Myxococcus dinghuensis]
MRKATSSGEPSLSARMARQALHLASRRGLPVEAWLRESAGLGLADLDDPELRVPYALLDDLLERMAAGAGDANLGLHIARVEVVDLDDPATFVVLTSATLRDSLERGCRYQRVWGDGERFRVEDTERGVRMRFTPVGAWRPAHRHLVEAAMSQLATGVSAFTGADVKPLRVRFVHAAPSDVREHEALFRCPLEFGAPFNDIEFSHEDARRPFVHADGLLHAMFERQASRALERLPDVSTLTGRVREQVRRTLAGGDCSFGGIAQSLRMSPRTLQRRLADEGQRYAAIVDALRRELSETYLRRRMAIAEVSFLLGYAEPAAFHRAFKRWWGMSPEQFRRAHPRVPE